MELPDPLHLPGPFAGVVLDMDGTLIDTEPIWLAAKQRVFADHGTTFEHADHLAVFGRDDIFTAAYLTRRFGLADGEQERVRRLYLDEVGRRFGSGIALRPGTLELLTTLHGRVPLALASNTRRELVEIALAATGLGRFLDAVATSDDAEPKPAPGIYLEACRRIGIATASSARCSTSSHPRPER
ncbi:MAG: HAD family hydrolase, partial [Chloroflexota bacterium]